MLNKLYFVVSQKKKVCYWNKKDTYIYIYIKDKILLYDVHFMMTTLYYKVQRE